MIIMSLSPWNYFERLENLFKNTNTTLTFPHINHWSDNNHHIYTFDLPGLTKEDVKIKFDKKALTLTVSGNKVNLHEEKKENKWHIKQSYSGSFTRTMSVPYDSKPESVKATFKDGVLTVSFEKDNTKKLDEQTVNIL